ncbi:DUF1178 domain-containing protein [Loktanella sp. D2R18]|uniref:DUF1178 family protein n=1 Tax=Rhodobacterales TaxID=204455 RepID=UPI000DEB5FF0|nr:MULTISPECIES: DUF1178 family protein [Rhodobacterales]MDO6590138.1 DUF1178 family protein [Yoonia sp. 1_MG-2023]RBW45748.1 DUF1178 domain-containing protein [Loktanella sp. D2R18]
MIRFHLKCDQGHAFESWFQSGEAFDKLSRTGLITCETCGSTAVRKSIMAPAVSTSADIAAPKPAENPIEKLRDEVESKSDYVGDTFVKEARDMHDGVTPERPIYGEAKLDEAKKLIDDGIPVMPLPFIPRKKAN